MVVVVFVGYLFASWVTVFAMVVVVFVRHYNLFDDVGVVFMCVCNLSVEVWFEFSGACSRVGGFANFIVLVCAAVVFVAGDAASFLAVYQKMSVDDRVLLLQIFLLLGSRFWIYRTSKKRLICHHGQ